MMSLRGINHIVLKVRDLEASDKFYGGVLGMKKVGARGRMWFYGAGAHYHDLALVEVGPEAPAPPYRSTGLFHFCLDVSDEKALADLHKRCREAGVQIVGTADHTMMRSFYVRDPDGHTIELGVDIPESERSHKGDPFAIDLPYDIPV
jgi:catechol 2,3-dioxygenase